MPRKLNQDAVFRGEVLALYLRLTPDRPKHFQTDITREPQCSPQTVARRVEIIERHVVKSACIERVVQNRRRYYRVAEGSLLKERPTTFSLHRIQSVSPIGAYFKFDAADLVARNFGLNWHEPRRFNIRMEQPVADYVRDRIWSVDQTIDAQPDGGLILDVTTTSERELKSWVWSFGGSATIVPAANIVTSTNNPDCDRCRNCLNTGVAQH